MFGLFNFEVFRRQLDWSPLPAAAQRITNGALQIKVELIAVFVLLSFVRALVTLNKAVLLMLTLLVLRQVLEQVAQRF